MEKRYFTDYSYYVGRDMTWHVHGSAGRIVIALPSQGDRCWDYENHGMVAVGSDLEDAFHTAMSIENAAKARIEQFWEE